ncbi:MAG: hypothetical protein V4719_13280 [Planctomycetota bacterium]
MLLFIACLLGQLEPTKTKEPTAAEFIQTCEDFKESFVERETVRAERAIKYYRGRGQIVLRYKKYLAALKQVAKDDTQLPQCPLRVDDLAIGNIGYPKFVFLGEEHNGFAGAKVLQLMDGDRVLCTVSDKVFVATGLDTDKIVDNDPIELPGIWRVSGRYSYQNTLGAQKTVLVISPWKHEAEFNNLIAERKKQAIDVAVTAKKKSVSKKSSPMEQ